MHHVWRIEVLEGVFLCGRKYALSEWTFFFFCYLISPFQVSASDLFTGPL